MAHSERSDYLAPLEAKTGVVARVIPDKAFVFLKANDEAAEYFAHRSGFLVPEEFDALAVGDKVQFVGAPTHKGPRAQQIVLI